MSKSVATDICRFFLPFFVSRSISKKYVFELPDHEKKVGKDDLAGFELSDFNITALRYHRGTRYPRLLQYQRLVKSGNY